MTSSYNDRTRILKIAWKMYIRIICAKQITTKSSTTTTKESSFWSSKIFNEIVKTDKTDKYNNNKMWSRWDKENKYRIKNGKKKERERYGRWKEFAKETQYSNKINGCNDDKKREEWKAPNADMRKNIYPH